MVRCESSENNKNINIDNKKKETKQQRNGVKKENKYAYNKKTRTRIEYYIDKKKMLETKKTITTKTTATKMSLT